MDTKKSTIAKRVRQITSMCDPRAYCCTKSNWIRSSRLWNNMPRQHSLGLLACIFAARKKSQEDIFAGRYFREKISSREHYIRENIFSGKYLKFTFRENFLPRKKSVIL